MKTVGSRGAARPTKADVARLANVSTATVSYVLNNVEGQTISARTRAAVQSAAQELGYRPNLAARNLAVEHCRGELLAFLDDDDEWLPEKTKRQVEALSEAAADVSGVQCGWEFWSEDDGVAFTFVPDWQRDLRRVLLERPTMAPSSVLLRRSAFEEAGGFDPTLPRMEDWDLWLKVADRHRFVLIPDVLARRRGHPGRLVAAEELPALQVMLERLRPRLAALPANERARIELLHTINIGRMQARCRHRARSLMTLLGAWRRAPGSRDVYKAVFVTFVVETPMWRLARRARLRLRAGRPPSTDSPPVRSW